MAIIPFLLGFGKLPVDPVLCLKNLFSAADIDPALIEEHIGSEYEDVAVVYPYPFRYIIGSVGDEEKVKHPVPELAKDSLKKNFAVDIVRDILFAIIE